MSAQAWVRRGRTKRFRMAVKAAMKQVKLEPWRVVRLEEFGLAVMSPQYYDDLLLTIARLEDMDAYLKSLAV